MKPIKLIQKRPLSIEKIRGMIAQEKFDFPRRPDIQEAYDEIKKSRVKLRESIARIKQKLADSQQGMIATINEYPYNLQDELVHLVVWYRDDVELDRVQTYIETIMSKPDGESLYIDYVFFTNPNGNKSVKDIKHLHLIVQVPTIKAGKNY